MIFLHSFFLLLFCRTYPNWSEVLFLASRPIVWALCPCPKLLSQELASPKLGPDSVFLFIWPEFVCLCRRQWSLWRQGNGRGSWSVSCGCSDLLRFVSFRSRPCSCSCSRSCHVIVDFLLRNAAMLAIVTAYIICRYTRHSEQRNSHNARASDNQTAQYKFLLLFNWIRI